MAQKLFLILHQHENHGATLDEFVSHNHGYMRSYEATDTSPTQDSGKLKYEHFQVTGRIEPRLRETLEILACI